jgi:ABC-type transport system involved in cytochrome c biogenesis permease subunit
MKFTPRQLIPAFVCLGAALFLTMKALPAGDPDKGMHLEAFSHTPVQDGGRIKPLDTFARTSLLIISGKEDFKDEDGTTQPAIRWLLDVMTSGKLFQMANAEQKDKFPLAGGKAKVFRIDNPQVRDLLGLEQRSGSRYALNEFADKMDDLEKEFHRVLKIDEKKRSAYDAKALETSRHVQLYGQIASWDKPEIVPPQSANGPWQNLQDSLLEARANRQDNSAFRSLGAMLIAYAGNDVESFNKELASYQRRLDERFAKDVNRSGVEFFFNHFEPFANCSWLYVGVFLLACVSWLGWSKELSLAALCLLGLTLLIHTWALGTRMYLQGRPPITNLYSSAVFVGWGAILLGLGMEVLFRNGLATACAAMIGFLTLRFAIFLGGSGDTLEMLQAVLDTNFWLATHVTCVAIGYLSTLFAGVLGIAYIILGVWTPALRDRSMAKTLGQMTYGVICFATLFSFTGTILGGIWADYSWGRFWGWDPKENGALLIVLWNALILHARWGGIVKQAGVAWLAVAGNMVVGWSWVGTNQLGVGLHAYGFNNTLAAGLVGFWAIHAAILGMGFWPRRLWKSFAPAAVPEPEA